MKLRSIQILRAVAALGVAAFHVTHSRFVAGSAGVDLFFVISGFVIMRVAGRKPRAEFIADRLCRIFPLYLLCAGAYYFVTKRGMDSTCRDIASATLLPLGCAPYLPVAWTLTYELIFYAAIALGSRWLVMLLIFAPAISPHGNLLVLEFLAGTMISQIPLDRRMGALVAALGVLIILVSPDMAVSNWRALVWGAPSAAIVYGALSFESLFNRRTLNFPILLGDASYSIYLTHFIVHVLPMGGWWPLRLNVMIWIGLLVHLVIERPLLKAYRSASQKWFRGRRDRVAAATT